MIFSVIYSTVRRLRDAGVVHVLPRMKYNWINPMWICLRVYNHETEHDSLWLYDTSQVDEDGWVNKIIKYTPDEVWKSPQLRYRIRLRNYLNASKNYKGKRDVPKTNES